MIIITVEFTPIQLGFGFTLNGVGGLLGINRTMSTDALRAGVKQRTLDAILFPKNPAANAPQLIAALKPVFPPAESRYTFGPMVKIGWGPSSLLEIEAALILELPSPLRLAVLGRISAILPDKKAAIVSLRLDVAGIVDFDRGEISVDASLVDSSLAMFALTGDMALRAGWKADKTFALSAGGFNPRFAPPPSFPTLERLAISLANSDNPRLRLESYFALTANTVQFGARINFYAKADTFVGTFSAAAFAGFDAMVQFQPFGFVADFCMGIELAHNGEPFLAASLYATISGPRPWHVTGVVEFVFLGKHQISVDVMIGEAGQPPAAQVTLTPEIVRALEAADAWTAELPDVAGQLVTLRSGTPDLVDLVHPLGSMTVRQRLLPLELAVARFGQAVPAPGTANRFAISATALIAGGTTISRHEGAALAATHDDFAPGQFLDLTDDQKLAGPAFQSMPSGVRVATATRRWPTAGADPHPLGSMPTLAMTPMLWMRRRRPCSLLPPLAAQVLLPAEPARRNWRSGSWPGSCPEVRRRTAPSGWTSTATPAPTSGSPLPPTLHGRRQGDPAAPGRRRQQLRAGRAAGYRQPCRAGRHRRGAGPMSAYGFLRWLRSGASAAIMTPRSGAGAALRASFTAVLTLTDNLGQQANPQSDLTLFGPGDVIGLDSRQVLRFSPQPESIDASYEQFPHVEFDEPALPWLFTPFEEETGEPVGALAGALPQAGTVLPWLTLVVVAERAGVALGYTPGALLPVLHVDDVTRELPRLSDAHAWAHVQITGGLPATAEAFDTLLSDRPDLSLSRLICPRLLQPSTRYLACVIPVFKAGS